MCAGKGSPFYARSVPRFRAVPGSHRFIAFTKGMPSPLALYMASRVVSYYSDTLLGILALTRVCRPFT